MQKVLQKKKWTPTDDATLDHVAALTKARGLSTRAIKALSSKYFRDLVANRAKSGADRLTSPMSSTAPRRWIGTCSTSSTSSCGFQPHARLVPSAPRMAQAMTMTKARCATSHS